MRSMAKLTQPQVTRQNEEYHAIQEDPTSVARATEGIIAADALAQSYFGRDTTLRLAGILSEIRGIRTSDNHDTMARYMVGRLTLRNAGEVSATLGEDVVATAYRGAAVAILDMGLRALDGKVKVDFLDQALRLKRHLEARRSDNAQLNAIRDSKSHSTIMGLIDALRSEVIAPIEADLKEVLASGRLGDEDDSTRASIEKGLNNVRRNIQVYLECSGEMRKAF